MISCIFFLTKRGDVILSSQFRDSFSVQSLAERFRASIMSQNAFDQLPPVNIIDGICFIHLIIADFILVMTSRNNVHCIAAMQYALRFTQLIAGYFKKVGEEVIRENFATILELFDETIDFGYPQLTEVAALQELISSTEGLKNSVVLDSTLASAVTKTLCGSVPWRTRGLVYHVNEVFVDVVEELNMLLSREGVILNSFVGGKVLVKNFLTGMPRCELVLNTRAFGEGVTGMEAVGDDLVCKLEDIAFHPCVRLNRYDEEQKIQFIPPDGEFLVLSYRSSGHLVPPLIIAGARIEEISPTRTEMRFFLKAEFSDIRMAEKVRLYIPCPDNTATVSVVVGKGVATYAAETGMIVWKLSSIAHGEEISFAAETKQITRTSLENTAWERPPIRIEFQFRSESLTGLKILSLPVVEPEYKYVPRKWIQYTTTAGKYQCRLSGNKVRS